jgi:hypothetical protein
LTDSDNFEVVSPKKEEEGNDCFEINDNFYGMIIYLNI